MIRSFLDRLTLSADSDAIVCDGMTYSYGHLLRAIDDWRGYLSENNVSQGVVATLEGTTSLQTCAGLLALIDRGAITVPLTSLADAKRAEYHDIAQAGVIITVDGHEVRHCQHTGRRARHKLYEQLRHNQGAGLVLFSSGTSGRSKASVLDLEKALARYGPPKRRQRILSFLNLDHIGGINTLLHTLNQGGAVITVADRTPDTVLATIARHRVQVLPTTPTFLNMVLISGALQRHSLPALDLITYGTEPMPPQTLQRLRSALPDVRFKQTYGLSELGILPTRSKSDDTVWVKLGSAGFEHKVIDNVLWIRSEMAMLGYLNASAPFDEDGFFNTQDVVETDGEYMRILGRRSEVINVGGEKVYPIEVENLLLEVPNVAEATVTGHPSPVTGMVVKATIQLVEVEDERSVRRRVREYFRHRVEPFKVPVLVEVSTAAQHSDRFKKRRSST